MKKYLDTYIAWLVYVIGIGGFGKLLGMTVDDVIFVTLLLILLELMKLKEK